MPRSSLLEHCLGQHNHVSCVVGREIGSFLFIPYEYSTSHVISNSMDGWSVSGCLLGGILYRIQYEMSCVYVYV